MYQPQISKIAGEEWKNMTGEQKAPYEEVSKKSILSAANSGEITFNCCFILSYIGTFPQVAKKQKEDYNREMELYKQRKLEVRRN